MVRGYALGGQRGAVAVGGRVGGEVRGELDAIGVGL